jgi:hypothetical protein
LVAALGLSATAVRAQRPATRSYLELNFGAAVGDYGDGGFVFPGLSFLIGQQAFLSPTVFVEYQAGLALPTLGTGKLGLGVQSSTTGSGLSAGVRVFPNTLYLQFYKPTRRGQWNLSLEHAPFFQNRPERSFYSSQLFTVGRQWNLGGGRS